MIFHPLIVLHQLLSFIVFMASSSTSTNGSNGSNIEISSPYYLGSSGNPSTILVSTVFNGTGFAAWKRSMTLALSAKNKMCFVDGSLTPPDVNSNLFQN